MTGAQVIADANQAPGTLDVITSPTFGTGTYNSPITAPALGPDAEGSRVTDAIRYHAGQRPAG